MSGHVYIPFDNEKEERRSYVLTILCTHFGSRALARASRNMPNTRATNNSVLVFSLDAHMQRTCSALTLICRLAAFLKRVAREQRSIPYIIFTLVCTSIYSNSSACELVLPSGKKLLGLSNTRNRNFKRLEPQFQTSATRSTVKEDTESAVASAH